MTIPASISALALDVKPAWELEQEGSAGCAPVGPGVTGGDRDSADAGIRTGLTGRHGGSAAPPLPFPAY
jgi:hypothetical protein